MASTTGATAVRQPNQSAKITVHWLEASRSQRILWLLEELKVPYELKTYKRNADKTADPELKKIHPLGKAPVISIEAPGAAKPIVLAETAAIVEYLIDYYGKELVPKRYQEGKDGQIGGESESWLRNRYFMHYAEGSLFPILMVGIIIGALRDSPVPFFIRPILNMIAGKVQTLFLKPSYDTQFGFLESQLASSPDGGDFICGKELTGADIMMSFAIEVAKAKAGLTKEDYPKLSAYVDRLYEREAYKRAVQKIVEVEGQFNNDI